ncbi:MAG: septal ring lytic transglycosylase RlpA family protein [Bdellovibrionales bacterium]
MIVRFTLSVCALLALTDCAASRIGSSGRKEVGVASWYSNRLHGRRTASGEPYDKNKMTAAHRSLPFGTRVRVRNTATGSSVLVRINDRGPFVRGRIIDLSYAAAAKLDLIVKGEGRVELIVEP